MVFWDIYGFDLAELVVKRVKDEMGMLYEWYANECGQPITLTNDGTTSYSIKGAKHRQSATHKGRTATFKSHLRQKDSIEAKDELERYLT